MSEVAASITGKIPASITGKIPASITGSIPVSANVNAGELGGRALELVGRGFGAAGRGIRSLFSNRIAAIIAVIVLVLAVGGIWDTASNWGKALGNVSINGIDVSGMTKEEINEAIRPSLSMQVSHAQVKIFATEEAKTFDATAFDEEQLAAEYERIAQAEQISVEEAQSRVSSWSTDALALKAAIPFDDIIEQAMQVGRDDGGLPARLGLFFSKKDIPVVLAFDDAAVDALASEIDKTIGDARIDATVGIEDGVAHPIEGHDGMMVDRKWLAKKVSDAMVANGGDVSFVAEVTTAPSRIDITEAQAMSDKVNHALEVGAVFNYAGTDWTAPREQIGSWTRVETVEDNGSFKLSAHIDEGAAIPAVVQGAGAAVKSDDLTVKFAKGDKGIVVRTFGPGNVPEVAQSVEELNDALYGKGGTAWDAAKTSTPHINIQESDAPAALTLEQAINSGIITVIGEYTTEFSNYEGTENRNHNIKLAADILNNSIITADGGTWSFNDRSGDTNEEAGFWAAGSIEQGQYVDSIGGGICQVATTIFNAVFEAGLPVTTRFNHTLYIASYPNGRDAAVSYPDLDLAWKNDLASDVLLVMSYTDTTVTAQLYSVYTGYTVTAEEGEWQEGATYSTTFETDNDLGAGMSYLKTSGVDGSSISVYRTVRDEAGNVIAENTFESRYAPKDEVYVVGPGTDTSKLVHTQS